MQMPEDLVDEACEALSHRTYAAHELADHLWPERVERPLAAKKRAGHAMGRDLVLRGLAVQNPDGTYSALTMSAPAAPAPPPGPPAAPPEVSVQSNGEVFVVERRPVGRLAPTPAPAPSPQQPAPPEGELVVDSTGTVTRVRREVIGRARIPAPPQAPPQQPQPPPQRQPPPQQPRTFGEEWNAWAGPKYAEIQVVVALMRQVIYQPLDPSTRQLKLDQANAVLIRHASELAAWATARGLPPMPVMSAIALVPTPSTPTPPPPPPPASPPMQPPPPPGMIEVEGFGYLPMNTVLRAMHESEPAYSNGYRDPGR